MSIYVEVDTFRIGRRVTKNIKTDNEQIIISLNNGDCKLLIATDALPIIRDAINLHLGDIRSTVIK
jgi:hypothetical protein